MGAIYIFQKKKKIKPHRLFPCISVLRRSLDGEMEKQLLITNCFPKLSTNITSFQLLKLNPIVIQKVITVKALIVIHS